MTRRSRHPDRVVVDGILPVDKPSGITSHDVVHRLRKTFRLNKVGHGGTLDPAATGLLVLLLGRGTKCSNAVMAGDKTYTGTFLLGVSTDSYDAEGEILHEADCGHVTEADTRAQFTRWTGEVQQIPPMVSAIKKDGTPLYKLARQGKSIERQPRTLTIHRFEITRFAPPHIDFELDCTKGTYVRSLAHDIGQALGCGAHLSALRRTRSGCYHIDQATALDTLLDNDLQHLRTATLELPPTQT